MGSANSLLPRKGPYRAGLSVPVKNALPQGTEEERRAEEASDVRREPGWQHGHMAPPPIGLLEEALPPLPGRTGVSALTVL